MTAFSLKRPVTIFMTTLGLCLLGVISWQRLPVQLLPQFIFPEVHVNTGMAGASPEKIERELVIPIEGEIAALDDVHDIESRVFSDFANIKVSFEQGANMKFALLKLQQKMTALQKRLPAGTRINVNKFDTADLASFLMQLNIRGNTSLEELRETAERRVRSRLEQIDGVVNVQVGGGDQQTVGIQIDPQRCEALSVPTSLIQQKINAFHRQSEQIGRVLSSGKWIDVILMGQVDDLKQLRDLIIDPQRQIRLRDVAEIGYNRAEQTQFFRVDGKASVGIFVQKDNLSNMLRVSQAVLDEVAFLNESLALSGYELVVNFNQAELIQKAISRIERLAMTGAVLAIFVLFLFLRNVRFVAILLVAIPVSLLVTFNVMYGFDLSVNILSLCGLALAIGMLVDNGIVVMENIFIQHQSGREPHEASLRGTKGVARSIFAATGTTILVFFPVLFVESEAKLFVKELALSVIFPLLVSLIVALTIIPLLAKRALFKTKPNPYRSGRVQEIYRLLLKSAIRHRIRTVSLVVVFLLFSLFVGITFIISRAAPPPPARLDLYITMPRGSTLQSTDTVVRRLEQQTLELVDIEQVRANIRAEEAHIAISFVEPAKRTVPLKLAKIKENMRKKNERLEHVDLSFDRPRARSGGQRNDELSGILNQQEGLRLKGHDINTLRLLSERITQTLRSIPDIDQNSVDSDLAGGAPELQIRGDRLRLALSGLSMQQIMSAIWATRSEAAIAATPFPTSRGEADVSLQLRDAQKRQIEDIGNLKIQNDAGHLIPVKHVADIRIDDGAGNIVRLNQERHVQINYTFRKEAQQSKTRLGLARAQIERFVQELRLPKGYVLEKSQDENTQRVYYWMMAIGALMIYMFLAAQFESLSMPVIILGTVPTAIVGALFALTLTGTPLTLGAGAPMALLGLIVLLGIVVNNGIILLDRIASLRHRRGYGWQRAVIVAGQSRVRPIIMTSATTILGLFPLALKQGTEFELWPPFAITVLGGLAVSSLSTLIFIPVLYVGLEQTKNWLKKVGWLGITAGSVVSFALIFWFHDHYKSWLYTSLLILPLWFGLLGLLYAMKNFFLERKERQRLAGEKLTIQIGNLTKIYGAPGRFTREWRKQSRRWAKWFDSGTVPWQKSDLTENAIWMLTVAALVLYLHFFLDNGFWLTVLSVITLIWIFAARELWYRWRFVSGSPPKLKTGSFLKKILRRRMESQQNSEPKAASVTLLNIPKRGAFWIVLFFLAYLQVRIGAVGLTVTASLLALLLAQFKRIARKIERREIDPELPAGRLRKIKRAIYTIVRNLPVIRPPRKQVVALHGVSLEIGHGMFGLLGPNGAGKTTLMRILVGVLDEDRGSIKINNRNLKEHRQTFHGSIGYLPQDFGLYENMTPLEYLNYHALTNGIYEPDGRKQLIENIIKSVGLWERRNDKVKTFSGGMKQRIGIAQTLLHLPQIIVVDEPTAGLDPKERIRFRNLLSELAKERIVIFSTHIVEDISSTCEDLAVLDKGKLIYRGSPEVMLSRAQGKVFEASVPADDFSKWQQKLHIVQHSKTEDRIRIRFLSEKPITDLPAQTVAPTLEDAYVYLLSGKN
ncbi:MAG: efflux RND transporter permease subunit [bacterium]